MDDIRIVPSNDFQLHVFLMRIAKQITDEELKELKFYCAGDGGLKKAIFEEINDCISLFRHLKELRLLSIYNLAPLQAMIWHLGRKDLYREFVEFCNTQDQTLHFFVPSATPANGYKYVDFHIRGTRQFCRDELEELRNHLSILLCCPPKHIIIDGSQPENSLHLTFMVPEVCIEYLLIIKDDAKSRLHSYGVDRLRIDGQYIDCIDFREGECKPTLDKETAVRKILMEREQLMKDLESYQLKNEEYSNKLKDCLIENKELDKEISKIQKTAQEYQLFCLRLTNELEDVQTQKSHYDNQATVLHSIRDTGKTLLRQTLLRRDRKELKKMSSNFQSKIIKLIKTNRACKITASIMKTLKRHRKDIDKVKQCIRSLVNIDVCDDVYAVVLNLITLENAIAEKHDSDSESDNDDLSDSESESDSDSYCSD